MLGHATGDFVEQEHAWLRGQRARQLKPLAVQEREAAREPVGLGREPALVEQLDAPWIHLALAAVATERRRHHQVLEHGHAVKRLRNLKRATNTHAAAPLRGKRRDI